MRETIVDEKYFDKQKFADINKWSETALTDTITQSGISGDDFLKDMFTTKVVGYFYAHIHEEQFIDVYQDRPKFLDWLLRKRKKHTFRLTPKDILKNPPKGINTERIHIYEKL